MSRIRVGQYLLKVEGPSGVTKQWCTANSGHPARGDEYEHRDRTFIVRKVRHVEENPSSKNVFTYAEVWVRPSTGHLSPDPTERDDGTVPGSAGRVLQFRQPVAEQGERAQLTSTIFPLGLVVALVIRGYADQSQRFRHRSNVLAAEATQQGVAWKLEEARRLWVLSRHAKEQGLRACDYLRAMFDASEDAASESASAAHPHLRLCA